MVECKAEIEMTGQEGGDAVEDELLFSPPSPSSSAVPLCTSQSSGAHSIDVTMATDPTHPPHDSKGKSKDSGVLFLFWHALCCCSWWPGAVDDDDDV